MSKAVAKKIYVTSDAAKRGHGVFYSEPIYPETCASVTDVEYIRSDLRGEGECVYAIFEKDHSPLTLPHVSCSGCDGLIDQHDNYCRHCGNKITTGDDND